MHSALGRSVARAHACVRLVFYVLAAI